MTTVDEARAALMFDALVAHGGHTLYVDRSRAIVGIRCRDDGALLWDYPDTPTPTPTEEACRSRYPGRGGAVTTVDEARAALHHLLYVAAVKGASQGVLSSVTRREFDATLDTLIAAVRAETPPLRTEERLAIYKNGWDDANAESEAKLAALREAAGDVYDLSMPPGGPEPYWYKVQPRYMDALRAALAATPAEDGEGRT